jgi:hypothetical protein
MSRLLSTAVLLLASALLASGAPVPLELQKAFETFRSEGAKGWAFTQTTDSGGKSLVERYEPAKPEFARWQLLKKDGRAPTEKELKEYKDVLSRRSRGETAPNVINQLDLATCTVVSDDAERTVFQFRLKPGAEDDKSAAHMAATFSLHKASGAIERFEIASVEPFSPMFSVNISEARTIVTYSLPSGERPSLIEKITVRVRGRAMIFKSLDEDMTVTYGDYAPAKR